MDYRLAPEHKFPAANEDCLAACHWLIDSGIRAEKIVIGGDLAGGTLTIMTSISLRDTGGPLPVAAFMLSTVGDYVNFDGESYESRAGLDPWLKLEVLPSTIAYYIDPSEDRPPILSPIR